MAAFRSAPRGERHLGWGAWAVALVGAYGAPPAFGLAVLAMAALMRRAGATEVALTLLQSAGLLIVSAWVSWVWLLLLLPLASGLLRLGLAGWANMAAAGAAAGSLGGAMIPSLGPQTGAVLGAASALILRMIWGWFAPSALDPGVDGGRG